MADGHSHMHEHGLEGGWSRWVADPVLRIVLGGVVVAAIATIIGLAVLWPTGEGRDEAVATAREIGLVSDRLAGTVEAVEDRRCSYSTDDAVEVCRNLTFIVEEGPEAGSIVALPEINLTFDPSLPDLGVGDRVVLGFEPSTNTYFYADRDRQAPLIWLTGIFALVVIALGRVRGVLALGAMAATLMVFVGFVAPAVLDGHDPLLVSLVAASTIAFVSLYLTHGFSPTTTVALAGTLGALLLTLALSWFFFRLSAFSGLASEEALVLPFISRELDVGALLLGGAIIGALGALDDVTVTQVATVAELRHRSPKLPTTELVSSGIRVGREHIASTVNTLLLAYAGASMPLLLLFAVSDQSLPTVANSEIIALEIVRTLCGSIGLVAAVPITTALAAAILRPETVEAADMSSGPSDKRGSKTSPAATEQQDAAAPADSAQEPEPVEEEARAPRWEDFSPLEED